MSRTNRTWSQRWARRLIACYPALWRQRYAEEMLFILEETPPTGRTLFNLLFSLIDAYLHKHLVEERTTSMQEHLHHQDMTPVLLNKMRANGMAIYSATLIFFVSWLMIEAHFVATNGPRVLFRLNPTSSLPLNILYALPYLMLLFVLFGGLPILLAAILQSLRERKIRALLFCLLALISPLVTLLIAAFFTPPIVFLAPFSILIALLTSLLFIAFAVEHVTPARQITSYALMLASAIPILMLLSLIPLLVLVVPALFAVLLSGDILYVLREDLLILIMGGTLIYSLLALKKGFQARRAMQTA